MRIASFVLGLLGGLIGLLTSYIWLNSIVWTKQFTETYGMDFAEVIDIYGYTEPAYVELAAWLSLICYVLAIIGTAFALNKPIISRWLLLFPAIAVLLFGIVDVLMGISIAFLILAGIFSFIEAKQEINNTLAEKDDEDIERDENKEQEEKGLFKTWWNANKHLK